MDIFSGRVKIGLQGHSNSYNWQSLNREKKKHTNAQLEFISQPVHLSTFLTVDHPKVRNMTTEMEDDEEIMLPDNWVLKLNTESVHLFENHSIGMALTAVFLNRENEKNKWNF